MRNPGWFGLIAAFLIGVVVVMAYNNNNRQDSLGESIGEAVDDTGRSIEDAGD